MNQLEERARQARQDIEASTSLVEPMPFRPPPSHRAAVSTAAVLMIAGGGLAFGASRITSDGGVVESADPSDQSDAGRDSVPMIGSTAIEVDEPGEPADSTGRDSGPSSGAGSDSDSSPGSYADPDTDDRPAGDDASADESDSAADTEPSPDATEPDPEATSTDPTDGSDNDDSDNNDEALQLAGAVLTMDFEFVDAEPAVVPGQVASSAEYDIYGQAGAANPFESGDLLLARIYPSMTGPPIVPRGDEQLTIGGSEVVYQAATSVRSAGVEWTGDDGVRIRVGSHSLDRNALVAAATSLLIDGELDAGGLDLLATDVRSTSTARGIFQPGATLYIHTGNRPSPPPPILREHDVAMVMVEIGPGSNEYGESLFNTFLTLAGDNPTVVAPPQQVSLVSPEGVEVTATSIGVGRARLRFSYLNTPVTLTVSGLAVRNDPHAESLLDLVDNIRVAGDDEAATLIADGQSRYGAG